MAAALSTLPTGTTTRLIFSDETVTSISGRWDKLWIGTNGHGLFSYDGFSITNESSPEDLGTGAIWSMYQTVSEGRAIGPLYIGGQHGVFKFVDGQVSKLLSVEDVRDVFASGNDIWAP